MRSVAFAAVIQWWEPWADTVQWYSWVVDALSSHVFAACLLLCWCGTVGRISSLAVLGVPFLSYPPFIFIYLFIY